MADPSLSARRALRDRTADLHAALDARLAATDFDDAASYAAFLRAQAPALFALEEMIEAAPLASIGDWPARRRAPAMRADLQLLGRAAPPPAESPAFENDALIGALYVLEGSRLGARHLVRVARASREPLIRAATAFLAHGEAEPFWPGFLHFLKRREAQGLDAEALVAGARGAFGLFLAGAEAALQPP